MRRVIASIVLASSLLALFSCATYSEDLNRGQKHFEANEYERALALWRVLEHDTDSLSAMDRARYCYLRGMTDFRMNIRPDARHWLAVAKQIDKENPGGLQPAWKERLEEALADLDKDVFGGADGAEEGEPEAPPAAAPPAKAGRGSAQ